MMSRALWSADSAIQSSVQVGGGLAMVHIA